MRLHLEELTVIVQELADGLYLGEALRYPEISRLGESEEEVVEAVRARCQGILEELPPLDVHRRHGPGSPVSVSRLLVGIAPPDRRSSWRHRVEVPLHAVSWSHGEEAQVGLVPALGIQVIAPDALQLQERLQAHVLGALRRRGLAGSLEALARLEGGRSISVVQVEYMAAPGRHRAESIAAPGCPVLQEIATDLTAVTLTRAHEVDAEVEQLARSLGGSRACSVVLVGPPGVGKTALLHELVRRREDVQLGHTPFWATSGARIVAGMTGFGMWQERCLELLREASRIRAVLHLGSLVELMEMGRYEGNELGVAAFLRPHLVRGDLLAVVECTPEELTLVERQDPHLREAFRPQRLEEPSEETAARILRSVSEDLSASTGAVLDQEALRTLDRLHRRYATYSAYPGRPLRFLRQLLADQPGGRVLRPPEVTAAFSRETGLPTFMLEDSERLDLTRLREDLAGRVMGQEEAVELVVGLLAAVKARLTRPGRPIASLLLIGPTGVGKTEMARALAHLLFRDEERMVRFDMSEYADELAVERLHGGAFYREGLLTARVREQPFSVVLLDEVEKAHESFWDLLLQVLGEGRLTDPRGRRADFQSSVVIMTSNLGAESYQAGPAGFLHGGRSTAREHFTEAVRECLRPEVLGRIDAIVPFAPLGEETVRRIVHRQLEQLRHRDGVHLRGLDLTWDPEVAAHLARTGHDPRYGARPLHRALERQLLAPLGRELNRHGGGHSLAARVSVEGERLTVAVQPVQESNEIGTGEDAENPATAALQVTALRRDLQALHHSPAALEVRNEIFRLRTLDREGPRHRQPAAQQRQLARLPALEELERDRESLLREVAALEEIVLLDVHAGRDAWSGPRARQLEVLRRGWEHLLERLLARQGPPGDRITLGLYAEAKGLLYELTRAYVRAAGRLGGQVRLRQMVMGPGGRGRKRRPVLETVAQVQSFLSEVHSDVLGLVLEVQGQAARAHLQEEDGVHLMRTLQGVQGCLVHSRPVAIGQYRPPRGVERQGRSTSGPRRRVYDLTTQRLEDLVLERSFALSGRELCTALEQALAEGWRRRSRRLLEG